MGNIKQFGSDRPLLFAILATAAWIAAAGVAAILASRLLGTPFGGALAQSLGTLTATACLLLVMGRWGWLRAAGVTRLGSWRLWLAAAALAVYIFIAYQLAFFGGLTFDATALWAAGELQEVLARQAVVGTVEEVLFRGFVLYGLVRVWARTRRGLLAAVTLQALLFGLPHILQLASGNPPDDTLMTIVNAFVSGLWLGVLVLLGGSVWPAVLIHAAGNAAIQLGALSVGEFDPSVADYAIATLADVPLVIGGLWLLLRRTPGSLPAASRERIGKAEAAASSAARVLVLLALAGVLVLSGCVAATEPAPAATPTPLPAPTQAIENRLSPADRDAIFETVWQTVNDGYFDPTFGGQDWQAIGARYRQLLAAVQDDRAFWLDVLNPMLFELGVSHIAALPPEFAGQLEPITFSAGTLGMDLRLLDGQAVIVEVTAGLPAAEAGLRPGFVITAVDGRIPAEIAAGGLQSPPNNERNRRASLAQSLRSLLCGEPGQTVEIAYLDENDRVHGILLAYAARSQSTCAPFDPSLPPACTEFEARRLPGGAGYIRFSGFLPTALDPVLQAIDDLLDAPALIIDLRGNPGGVFPVRKAIASKLVGAPKLFMRYQRRDGLEEAYLDRVPNPYRGEIVILVDELSASSSEEFAGSLQALGRATIVGSQTPGRCLVANIVPLPGDAALIYPYGQSQTPDGRVLEDDGVVPDVEVALTREQILQGVDAQLEEAVNLVAAGRTDQDAYKNSLCQDCQSYGELIRLRVQRRDWPG